MSVWHLQMSFLKEIKVGIKVFILIVILCDWLAWKLLLGYGNPMRDGGLGFADPSEVAKMSWISPFSLYICFFPSQYAWDNEWSLYISFKNWLLYIDRYLCMFVKICLLNLWPKYKMCFALTTRWSKYFYNFIFSMYLLSLYLFLLESLN